MGLSAASCYKHLSPRSPIPPVVDAVVYCLEPPFRTQAPISSAAGSVASWWLTAKGSHLAWGQDGPWGQLHLIPGRGGLCRWGHLVSRGDNSEGVPSSRASCGIDWSLCCDCVVDHCCLCLVHSLHSLTDVDPKSILNRLPAYKSPFQGQLPGNSH